MWRLKAKTPVGTLFAKPVVAIEHIIGKHSPGKAGRTEAGHMITMKHCRSTDEQRGEMIIVPLSGFITIEFGVHIRQLPPANPAGNLQPAAETPKRFNIEITRST